MVLKILVTILAIVLVAGMVLLFAPLAARFSFSVAGIHARGGGMVSFLHPAFFSVMIDIAGGTAAIRVLGREWGKRRKEKRSAGSSGDGAAPSAGEAEPMTAPEASTGEPEVPAINKAEDRLVPREESGGGATQDSVDVTPVPATDRAEHTAPGASAENAPVAPAPEPVPGTDGPSTVSGGKYDAGSQTPSGVTPEEKVAAKAKKKDNWFTRLERNRYLFFIRNHRWRSNVLRWFVRVIMTLFHLVRFDRFQVAIRAGVSDPVITGSLAGVYQALLYGLPLRSPQVLSYEPVFMRNHFECSGSIRVSTTLARVVTPLAVAVLTFPLLHTLWLIWCVWRRERHYRKEATA